LNLVKTLKIQQKKDIVDINVHADIYMWVCVYACVIRENKGWQSAQSVLKVILTVYSRDLFWENKILDNTHFWLICHILTIPGKEKRTEKEIKKDIEQKENYPKKN